MAFTALDRDLLVAKEVTCCRCHTPFWMPRFIYEARLADHLSFWCPLGHEQHFTEGKTEEQKLRERLANMEAARDFESQQRRAAEADAKRLRKAAKKAAKRAAAGVCPCCHRTVSQMARHIATKHPEYVDAGGNQPSKAKRAVAPSASEA